MPRTHDSTTKSPLTSIRGLRTRQRQRTRQKSVRDQHVGLGSDPADTEFGTKLNKIMNLSYKDTNIFRTQTFDPDNRSVTINHQTDSRNISGRRKSVIVQSSSPIIGRSEPATHQDEQFVNNNKFRFQTAFEDFVPKLNDVMKLSYMNTRTFRGTENAADNFDIQNFTPRRQIVKRKRVRMKKTQNTANNNKDILMRPNHEAVRSSSIVTNHNPLTRDPAAIPDNGAPRPSSMGWMWPPNSMDFNNFNFAAFDAQFTHTPEFGRSSILLPRVEKTFSYSHNNVPSVQHYANTPSYSLSIIL